MYQFFASPAVPGPIGVLLVAIIAGTRLTRYAVLFVGFVLALRATRDNRTRLSLYTAFARSMRSGLRRRSRP